MPTFLDSSIDTFFSNAGGADFLYLFFALLILFAIVAPFVRAFDA